MLRLKHKHHASFLLVVTAAAIMFGALFLPTKAWAADITCPDGFQTVGPLSEQSVICADHKTGTSRKDSEETTQTSPGKYQCGAGSNKVEVGFNFGCIGRELEDQGKELNPILDLLFSLIRTLSVGVGIMLVMVVVIAGIKYTTSQGDPQKTASAIKMVRGAIIGLLVYLFAFAFLQWLIPGGVFNNGAEFNGGTSTSRCSGLTGEDAAVCNAAEAQQGQN
jgi:heme A synthase